MIAVHMPMAGTAATIVGRGAAVHSTVEAVQVQGLVWGVHQVEAVMQEVGKRGVVHGEEARHRMRDLA